MQQTLDNREMRKHRNDVIRLYQLLSLEDLILLPNAIKDDMRTFSHYLRGDGLDVNQLGMKNTNLDNVLSNMSQIYGLA